MIKDIHLSNILVELPSTFNHLSVTEFYEKYGEPETVPITQQNGEPLPPNVPPKAVLPRVSLGSGRVGKWALWTRPDVGSGPK